MKLETLTLNGLKKDAFPNLLPYFHKNRKKLIMSIHSAENLDALFELYHKQGGSEIVGQVA
jgi:hypothetical protein